MMFSWWGWSVTGLTGVAVLIALRWTLADLLLDWFGSPRTDWPAYEHPEASEPTSVEADVSRAPEGDDDHNAGLDGLDQRRSDQRAIRGH